MTKDSFYITTPIYYVNDIPHIGHAYTSFAADSLARFKKYSGHEVFFLTGTDEHGQKVEESAMKQGITPEDFVNKVSIKFRKMTSTLNLINNDFIRTSERRHKKYVTEVWKKLLDNGDIYLGNYKGWYSVRDESFIVESDIKIDNKNNSIGPSGDILKWIEEPSYFFRLSKWQERLLDFYQMNKDFILPKSRYNEVVSFVKKGLTDLCISRNSFNWGIKVPNHEDHVIYVWLDALFNYISVFEKDKDYFDKFWPADYHIVGKDILRFHAVYWPAFLMSAKLSLPKRIFAHGWWTIEGRKMSKSLGNVINPIEVIEKYGSDQLRYFLLKEIPFGEDGNYSEISLINRINSELANDLGNLFQRVLSMLHKYFDGTIPEINNITKQDKLLINLPKKVLYEINNHMNFLKFNLSISEIWKIIKASNAYVDSSEPWKLNSINKERLKTVIYILIDTIYKIAILLQPFLPLTARNILNQLKQDENKNFSAINYAIKPGIKLNKPLILFPKVIR